MLATEDELSEAVCVRLLGDVEGRLIASQTRFRRGGFGYLKSRIDSFIQIAERSPLLLLTDLDTSTCASRLITAWTGGKPMPDRLLFRVAVREVESWLLADHEGLRQLMGSRIGKLPFDPDEVNDPKANLLVVARQAIRAVREDLLPDKGSTSKQGLAYNQRLISFVQSAWSPDRAASRSRSLQRTRTRLVQLADRLDIVT